MSESIYFQRIKTLAQTNNYRSAAALFLKTGHSKSMLYAIRDGKYKLSYDIAKDISKIVQVDINWLIEEDEKQDSEILKDSSSLYIKGTSKYDEKDRIIEDLRQLNDLLREKNRQLQFELDRCKDLIDQKERKTA
jgi:hypothetical protein